VDDVDQVPKGWSYSYEGNVIIKVWVVDSTSGIAIEPIALLPKNEEPKWEFGNDGYSDGWYPNFDVTGMEISNGYLKAQSIGGDPWLTSPTLEICAADYDTCFVKMKVNNGNFAQMFWATDKEPFFSEGKSIRFNIFADDNDHVYSLPVADKESWQGTINQLRLDPTDQGQAEFGIDHIRLVKGASTKIHNNNQSIANHLELLPNFPNPFNTSTQIKFIIPKTTRVALTIYDTLGRNVRTLIDQSIDSGSYKVCWDGKDDNEKQVSSGIYVFRLESASFVSVKKGLLLK